MYKKTIALSQMQLVSCFLILQGMRIVYFSRQSIQVRIVLHP